MTAALRRTALVILVAVLCGFLAAAYVVRANAKGVTSTAQLVITGRATASSQDTPYSANQYVNQRMSTYAALATGDIVVDPAAQSIGLSQSVLANSVKATVPQDTTVINLSATGPDPKQAQQRAQAVLAALSSQIVALETGPVEAPAQAGLLPAPNPVSRVDVRILSEANVPAAASLPPLRLAILGGILAGALLSVLGLLTAHLLKRRRVEAAAGPMDTVEPGTGEEQSNVALTHPPALGMKTVPRERSLG